MKPYFETLDINGYDSHEECMDQEPVSDKNDDRKSAELPNGAGRKSGQNSEDRVVRNNLQCV